MTTERSQSPQVVTFADFGAFVIAACFVVAVFVAPYIVACHYLDAHLPPSNPTTTSTPRKAGATSSPGTAERPDSPLNAGRALGVTGWRDSHFEDSSRSGLFALTHRGDPRWEMGRGGASLEGALGLLQTSVPPLSHLVCHVIGVGPKKQMRGVDARRVVAAVENASPVVSLSCWDRAIGHFPGHPMGEDKSPVNAKSAVPATICSARPYPTSICFLDLGKEALCYWASGSKIGARSRTEPLVAMPKYYGEVAAAFFATPSTLRFSHDDLLGVVCGQGRGKGLQPSRDPHCNTFGDGAAWSRSGINREAKDHGLGTYQGDGSEDTLKTCGRPISAKELLNVERNQGAQNGLSEFGSANRRTNASLAGIKPGHHLQTLARAAAHLCGIDPALFWSLILRESSGRHWDAQGRVLRSSSNALGLGQIKAATARGVSPLLDPLKPFDNAVASACHLRSLLDANRGNVRKSLHDYHAGAYRKRTTAATLAYASDILGAN